MPPADLTALPHTASLPLALSHNLIPPLLGPEVSSPPHFRFPRTA